MAQGVIRSHGLVERLKIDEDSLSKYLNSLERTYNACVYHNPMHAADVLHGTNFLLAGKVCFPLLPTKTEPPDLPGNPKPQTSNQLLPRINTAKQNPETSNPPSSILHPQTDFPPKPPIHQNLKPANLSPKP
jgi:hypothetical protein